MKYLFFLSLFVVFLEAGCDDSINASISTNSMKANYKLNDSNLEMQLNFLINSTKENLRKENNSYKGSADLKNLYIINLLEAKEINLLITKQNNNIMNQR